MMAMLALAIADDTISNQSRREDIIDGLFELPRTCYFVLCIFCNFFSVKGFFWIFVKVPLVGNFMCWILKGQGKVVSMSAWPLRISHFWVEMSRLTCRAPAEFQCDFPKWPMPNTKRIHVFLLF